MRLVGWRRLAVEIVRGGAGEGGEGRQGRVGAASGPPRLRGRAVVSSHLLETSGNDRAILKCSEVAGECGRVYNKHNLSRRS